jgi:hypothetical protein
MQELIDGRQHYSPVKKHFITPMFLLFSTSASANVIFPAFAAPHFAPALNFPLLVIAVLFIEVGIYKLASHNTPIYHLALMVAVANGASWIAGIMITMFLPSGLVTGEYGIEAASSFTLYATLGYVVAYVLSVIIEGYIVKGSSVKMGVASPFKWSFYANSGSYLTLVIFLWSKDSMPL